MTSRLEMLDPQGSFLCKIFQKECVGPKGIGVHEVGSEDLDSGSIRI